MLRIVLLLLICSGFVPAFAGEFSQPNRSADGHPKVVLFPEQFRELAQDVCEDYAQTYDTSADAPDMCPEVLECLATGLNIRVEGLATCSSLEGAQRDLRRRKTALTHHIRKEVLPGMTEAQIEVIRQKARRLNAQADAMCQMDINRRLRNGTGIEFAVCPGVYECFTTLLQGMDIPEHSAFCPTHPAVPGVKPTFVEIDTLTREGYHAILGRYFAEK